MLRNILFPTRSVATPLHVEPDFQYIHRELAKPGVNLTLLCTEYCNRCEQNRTTPYLYTQFCERYRHWDRLSKATMRIQHQPGGVIQVDWAGNMLSIHNHDTDGVDKAYLGFPCICVGKSWVQPRLNSVPTHMHGKPGKNGFVIES